MITGSESDHELRYLTSATCGRGELQTADRTFKDLNLLSAALWDARESMGEGIFSRWKPRDAKPGSPRYLETPRTKPG